MNRDRRNVRLLVLAQPTQGPALYPQMAGRAKREHPRRVLWGLLAIVAQVIAWIWLAYLLLDSVVR